MIRAANHRRQVYLSFYLRNVARRSETTARTPSRSAWSAGKRETYRDEPGRSGGNWASRGPGFESRQPDSYDQVNGPRGCPRSALPKDSSKRCAVETTAVGQEALAWRHRGRRPSSGRRHGHTKEWRDRTL